MILIAEYLAEQSFFLQVLYQYFQCIARRVMYYRLCQIHSIDLRMVGERREIFIQKIEIERDIVSDNYRIFSEEFLYFLFHGFSCRSCFQIIYRESGDESDDMFQFIRLLVWFDERLIFTDDLPLFINLYDPYLNGFILTDIESSCFKI